MRVRPVNMQGFVIGTVFVILCFVFVTAHARNSSAAPMTVQVSTMFSGTTLALQDFPVVVGNVLPVDVILTGTLPSIGKVDLLGAVLFGPPTNTTMMLSDRPTDSTCGSVSTVSWCLRSQDGRAWIVDQPTLSGGIQEGVVYGFGQTAFVPAIPDRQPPVAGMATLRTLVVTPYQDGSPVLEKRGNLFIQVDGFMLLEDHDSGR